MSKEPENKPQEPENNVEVTPEWAKQLQESLSQLPQQIKEALAPKEPDPVPDPEPQDPNNPIEIPLPQPPEPEPQPQPEPVEDPEPEPPKKKSLLKWLF